MDFDNAKENIQPLATGRNASILQASLLESPQKLLAQRRELEQAIHNYSGDDPLEPWYTYIGWIEQSFPSGGKESGLDEVLTKCLSRFEAEERYYQDRRMIKLYMKFIDNHKHPTECYQQLFNAGIGTMVADFYICWAYHYDLCGNTRKADEIFRRGIACRAQPFEELQEAHQHFGFSVAQRLMYKDDEDVKNNTNQQLQERRLALTSLRAHKRKAIVGSIRTGAAVKSIVPGTVKQTDAPSTSKQCNVRVPVFHDENSAPNTNAAALEVEAHVAAVEIAAAAAEDGKSVVRSIIDAARNQENQKEPGPWNKAKSGKLFGKAARNVELGFDILEDDAVANDVCAEAGRPLYPPIVEYERNYDKPFKYPARFYSKNSPQPVWHTPVTIETEADAGRTLPHYNKCMLYPRPNMEFCPEELLVYRWLKRRGIVNNFTKERESVWSTRDANANVRQYPNFAKQSRPQKLDALDAYYEPERKPGMVVSFEQLYDTKANEEYSLEELLARRMRRNETIVTTTDMEETMCMPTECMQRRKSFFPSRNSIAARVMLKNAVSGKIAEHQEPEVEQKEHENKGKMKARDSLATQYAKNRIEHKETQAATAVTALAGSSETIKLFGNLENHTSLAAVAVALKPAEDIATTTQNTVTLEDLNKRSIPSVPIPSLPKTDIVTAANSNVKMPFNIFEESNVTLLKTETAPPVAACSSQPSKSALPFDIYEDTSTKIPIPVNKWEEVPRNDFEFKAPAVPASGGIFEETCSTQTFNIFLKSQSVSTPKMPEKVVSRVLLERSIPSVESPAEEISPIPPVKTSVVEDVENANNSRVAVSDAAATAISPQRSPMKVVHLSTILEMSEHAISQGTHNAVGVSTKSAIGSPETEADQQLGHLVMPQNSLQPLDEQTRENSETAVVVSLKNIKLNDTPIPNVEGEMRNATQEQPHQSFQHSMITASAPKIPAVATTPSDARLQLGTVAYGGLNFSIFEDERTNVLKSKETGNFSRLDEREDTAAGYAMRSLRFQEDKTETMSKMLFTSKTSVKFQEDKTETMSKVLLAPPTALGFEDDKTETMPQMTKLTPPIAANIDDSFEFFGASPPPKLHSKPNVDFRVGLVETPLPSASKAKRFSEKNTPVVHTEAVKTVNQKQEKVGVLLFEDEVDKLQCSNAASQCGDVNVANVVTTHSTKKPVFKSLSRDSFLPDFSVIEESQPESQTVGIKSHKQSLQAKKTELGDSILNDFSVVDETQPIISNNTEQPQAMKSPVAKSNLSTSFLKDFSLIMETQPKPTGCAQRVPQTTTKSKLEKPCPKDYSMAMATDTIPLSMKTAQSELGTSRLSTSYRKNISQGIELGTVWSHDKSGSQKTSKASEAPPSILIDSYIKDFSAVQEPIRDKQSSIVQKTHIPLKFLDESMHALQEASIVQSSSQLKTPTTLSTNTAKLSLATEKSTEKSMIREAPTKRTSAEHCYELNANTEMFATNNSMIKNSTWLPQQEVSQIKEKSLHIKTEDMDFANSFAADIDAVFKMPLPPPNNMTVANMSLQNIRGCTKSKSSISNSTNVASRMEVSSADEQECGDDSEDAEMSIYYKQTPKTPKIEQHTWDEESPSPKTPTQNNYVRSELDPNQTHQIIDHICVDPNVNPFNSYLLNAFLEQIDFSSYIDELPNCQLVGHVSRVQSSSIIRVYEQEFEVLKLIGEGAYGAVYCGINKKTGMKYALKQERPPNFWEYYICLEVQSRLNIEEKQLGFMSIDYALIGNNASLLISPFSAHGSLISVCNKVKKFTSKNVDEYVVMILTCELLDIIDHLHAINIIHADIKADNFLLMKNLTYPSEGYSLQLIDFGVSIDMKLFKSGQTFNYVHNDNAFKCVEMREGRPWTYQLDLYGLAGVIHVLLFGKYMDISKRPNGSWMHKTHVPRYFNRPLWETIFDTLLNIRDCATMPNLQQLRALLKEEVLGKEKFVERKLNDFNTAINN